MHCEGKTTFHNSNKRVVDWFRRKSPSSYFLRHCFALLYSSQNWRKWRRCLPERSNQSSFHLLQWALFLCCQMTTDSKKWRKVLGKEPIKVTRVSISRLSVGWWHHIDIGVSNNTWCRSCLGGMKSRFSFSLNVVFRTWPWSPWTCGLD